MIIAKDVAFKVVFTVFRLAFPSPLDSKAIFLT
jgi:hypothetical protein